MCEQNDKKVMLADCVYQSMSRQLRCGNPVFTSVTFCLTSAEVENLSEDYLDLVATDVSDRLTLDNHTVVVSYESTPQPPCQYKFVGTIGKRAMS